MLLLLLLLLLFWGDSGTRAFYLLLFCFVVCYCFCCGQRAHSPFAAQPDAALHLHLSTPKEGLPKWLSGKESTCQCKRQGFHPWVRKIPWRRKWQPPPVFLPEESHGQRSLVGSWVHGVTKSGIQLSMQAPQKEFGWDGVRCYLHIKGRASVV